MESDEDSDSPDSIVPASSPESILGEEASRFPQLGSGRWEQDNRALSPVIPIIPRASIPGRGSLHRGWAWLGCQRLGERERQLELIQVPLSHSVFPDTKPYGALDLEAPGKLPTTTWEKGKGSEVSVMLTVSAAAAKVCPGGCLGSQAYTGQRAVPGTHLDKIDHSKLCTEDLLCMNPWARGYGITD